MAISFNKRENEKKRQQKKLEKQKRKEERKVSGKSSLDDMIAYVDENGMITSTPPNLQQKEVIEQGEILISIPKREAEAAVIRTGRVDFFSSPKGYGFIKNMENTEKYFFHISHAPRDIATGRIVTFDLEKSNRGGMCAVNITYPEEENE
jgi:cold shock CspA family protein